MEIIERIIESKKKNIRRYPQKWVRASEIGHPCERYLVYSILKWDQRVLHDVELEFIFAMGRKIEEEAIKEIEEAGYTIYRPEPDTTIMELDRRKAGRFPLITGHLDIRVDFSPDIAGVWTGEIKGLQPWDWEKLNCLDDFFRSKKAWIKKYPAQLMCYLFMKNEERGFFYLKNKQSGKPKVIWIDLDLDYMESILQKTERVMNFVDHGELPDPMEYDENVCPNCAFTHLCTVERKKAELVIDLELNELVNKWFNLKPIASEYNAIDGEMNSVFKGHAMVLVGDFAVSGKWIEKKDGSKYWKKSIDPISPDKIKVS